MPCCLRTGRNVDRSHVSVANLGRANLGWLSEQSRFHLNRNMPAIGFVSDVIGYPLQGDPTPSIMETAVETYLSDLLYHFSGNIVRRKSRATSRTLYK